MNPAIAQLLSIYKEILTHQNIQIYFENEERIDNLFLILKSSGAVLLKEELAELNELHNQVIALIQNKKNIMQKQNRLSNQQYEYSYHAAYFVDKRF